MNLAIILLLACVWIFLAFRAFERGNMYLAGIYIVAGIALTIFRLRSRSR